MESINLHQKTLEAGGGASGEGGAGPVVRAEPAVREGAGPVVREVFVTGPEPASPGTSQPSTTKPPLDGVGGEGESYN